MLYLPRYASSSEFYENPTIIYAGEVDEFGKPIYDYFLKPKTPIKFIHFKIVITPLTCKFTEVI
jgi:hypothetical protein